MQLPSIRRNHETGDTAVYIESLLGIHKHCLINRFGFYGGDFAIGAYGIVSRIYMLFSMIIIGLAVGMQPIIGYNFGAGQTERVDKAMNTG